MKVSILMPIYNGEEFVERCFNSIFSSTFQDYEIIAVNDGSTDNTEKLLSELEQRDKRVHVYNLDHSGIVSALNYGLEKCKGEYIARMDIDDEMLPGRLEFQSNYLDSSDYDIIGGEIIFEPSKMNMHGYKTTRDCSLKISLYHPELCHPSIMIRSSSLKKHDLKYIEGTAGFVDVVFFIEAQLHGLKLRNLSGPVLIRHLHPNQITKRIPNNLHRQRDYIETNYKDLLIQVSLENNKNIKRNERK